MGWESGGAGAQGFAGEASRGVTVTSLGLRFLIQEQKHLLRWLGRKEIKHREWRGGTGALVNIGSLSRSPMPSLFPFALF